MKVNGLTENKRLQKEDAGSQQKKRQPVLKLLINYPVLNVGFVY